jgi:hypothetical protein
MSRVVRRQAAAATRPRNQQTLSGFAFDNGVYRVGSGSPVSTYLVRRAGYGR